MPWESKPRCLAGRPERLFTLPLETRLPTAENRLHMPCAEAAHRDSVASPSQDSLGTGNICSIREASFLQFSNYCALEHRFIFTPSTAQTRAMPSRIIESSKSSRPLRMNCSDSPAGSPRRHQQQYTSNHGSDTVMAERSLMAQHLECSNSESGLPQISADVSPGRFSHPCHAMPKTQSSLKSATRWKWRRAQAFSRYRNGHGVPRGRPQCGRAINQWFAKGTLPQI
ncbi:hypothetical protein GE09DRAFT_194040 [Coniochaeta sp. 2T2.1]|nr:hypothetical protein GE09DRAFT_194040 [Coniochaeta sp. 2T2.1]